MTCLQRNKIYSYNEITWNILDLRDLILFLELPLKIYDTFIIIIESCFCESSMCTVCVCVCLCKSPDSAELSKTHLIWISLQPVFKESHYAVVIGRWESRNAWEQNLQIPPPPPPPFSRLAGPGPYQLLEKEKKTCVGKSPPQLIDDKHLAEW